MKIKLKTILIPCLSFLVISVAVFFGSLIQFYIYEKLGVIGLVLSICLNLGLCSYFVGRTYSEHPLEEGWVRVMPGLKKVLYGDEIFIKIIQGRPGATVHIPKHELKYFQAITSQNKVSKHDSIIYLPSSMPFTDPESLDSFQKESSKIHVSSDNCKIK